MTKHWPYLLLSTAMLAACGGGSGAPTAGGGSGFLGGGGVVLDPTDDGIVPEDPADDSEVVVTPAALSDDLGQVIYDSGAGTLQVSMLPFDGSPQLASYMRDAGLDISGYQAYELEENSNSRKYYALFKTLDHVTAGSVATDVDFNTYFGGSAFQVLTAPTLPGSGIATYQAPYAGLWAVTNTNEGDGPTRVTGDALLNIDFNDLVVEGNVQNRQTEGGANLPEITLFFTALDGTTFIGQVKDTLSGDTTGVYGGAIGGSNAAEVATVLVFEPIPDTPNEYGSFVADLGCISSPGAPC